MFSAGARWHGAVSIAAELGTMERVFLFCLASGTDWITGVTHATAQHMLVGGFIDRDAAASRFALTPLERGAGRTFRAAALVWAAPAAVRMIER